MLSTRYADEGYIPGTYYRGLSYYAALDKKWNLKNTVSLIALGAPVENGRQAASVQEAMDLAGTNFYNPSWGYQNGAKRNSNVATAFQPAFMGVYEYKPNNHTNWTTTLGYISGKKKIPHSTGIMRPIRDRITTGICRVIIHPGNQRWLQYCDNKWWITPTCCR